MSSEWEAWAIMAGLNFGQEGMHGEYVAPRLQERVTVDEWALPEEGEKLASSVAGLFDQFIMLATIRWQKGVDEYRGGDETLQFDGDPLQEALEETADIYAYSKVANDQGLLTNTEADQLNCLAYDAFKLITHIQSAHKEKHDKETERLARQEAASKTGLIVEETS
jgi:hypothetical protein